MQNEPELQDEVDVTPVEEPHESSDHIPHTLQSMLIAAGAALAVAALVFFMGSSVLFSRFGVRLP